MLYLPALCIMNLSLNKVKDLCQHRNQSGSNTSMIIHNMHIGDNSETKYFMIGRDNTLSMHLVITSYSILTRRFLIRGVVTYRFFEISTVLCSSMSSIQLLVKIYGARLFSVQGWRQETQFRKRTARHLIHNVLFCLPKSCCSSESASNTIMTGILSLQ